jgi:hypothetical protein
VRVMISSEIPQVPAASLALALVSVPVSLRRERGSGTDTNLALLGAGGSSLVLSPGPSTRGDSHRTRATGGIDMNTMATM